MSDTIFTSQTPGGADNNNVATQLGATFTVSSNATVSGGRYWIHSGGLPTTAVWQLWRVSDTSLLASFDLTTLGSPTSNAWNSFSISPVSIVTTESYVVCAYTNSAGLHNFVLTNPFTYPIGSGIVSASEGRFRNGGLVTDFPNGTFGAAYFADVNVDAASSTPSSPALIVAQSPPLRPIQVTTPGPSLLGPQVIRVAPFATNRPPLPPFEPPITAINPPFGPPQVTRPAPIVVVPQTRTLTVPPIVLTPPGLPQAPAPITSVFARGQGQLATVITLTPSPLPQAAAPTVVVTSSWRLAAPQILTSPPPLLPPFSAVTVTTLAQRQPSLAAPVVGFGQLAQIVPLAAPQPLVVTAHSAPAPVSVFVGMGILGEQTCTVPRPNTGTAGRPSAGTVTRPNTGIVEDPC